MKVLLLKHEFEYLVMKLQMQGCEQDNRLAWDYEGEGQRSLGACASVEFAECACDSWCIVREQRCLRVLLFPDLLSPKPLRKSSGGDHGEG